MITGTKQERHQITHMVGMVVGEKNPVDIVIGNPQIQQLFKVAVTKIEQPVFAVVLKQYTRRVTVQRRNCGARTQNGYFHGRLISEKI